MRFKLVIEYDGTDYHGWQIQPNGRTVQAILEDAIVRMLGETTRVNAAGRTDAGVHAAGQVVTFTLQRDVSADTLQRGLNALTPPAITVRTAEPVADNFDPRRARSRVYRYHIWNTSWPSPFWRRYAWHISRRLDVAAMQRAAVALVGEHDFTSFRAAGCAAAHPVRRVLRSEVMQHDTRIVYQIEATAFLRHMVRNIVGTLVEIGAGERPVTDLQPLLEARDRSRAGATAPAHGLCLMKINY